MSDEQVQHEKGLPEDFQIPNAKVVYRHLADIQGQVAALTEAVFFIAARDPKKPPNKAASLSDLRETRDLFRLLPKRVEPRIPAGIKEAQADNLRRGVERTSKLLVVYIEQLMEVVEEEEEKEEEGEGDEGASTSLLSRWQGTIARHAAIEALTQILSD